MLCFEGNNDELQEQHSACEPTDSDCQTEATVAGDVQCSNDLSQDALSNVGLSTLSDLHSVTSGASSTSSNAQGKLLNFHCILNFVLF